jgi:hypothetical protein
MLYDAPAGSIPRVTPRSYGYRASLRPYQQLLAHSGRFSLCAQTETAPYKYVSVEGPSVAIEDAHLERDLRPSLAGI